MPSFSGIGIASKIRHALYLSSKRHSLIEISPRPCAFLLFIKETTFPSSSLEKRMNSSACPKSRPDEREESQHYSLCNSGVHQAGLFHATQCFSHQLVSKSPYLPIPCKRLPSVASSTKLCFDLWPVEAPSSQFCALQIYGLPCHSLNMLHFLMQLRHILHKPPISYIYL